MNNYEKYKERINAILNSNSDIAIDRETNEITACKSLACSKCLFSIEYNRNYNCHINSIKWLVAEYKESAVDWDKIPIDTPVLVSDNGFQGEKASWIKMHFAGVDTEGNPLVYYNGRTSWSNRTKPIEVPRGEIKLAEGVGNE